MNFGLGLSQLEQGFKAAISLLNNFISSIITRGY
jgi:hypothetical protein